MMPAQTSPAVLITGAAKRIGRAIALGLAADGCTVVVHYNKSINEAAEVVDAVNANGGRALTVKADLNDEADTQALVPRAADVAGPLTCLINNASIFLVTVACSSGRGIEQTNAAAASVTPKAKMPRMRACRMNGSS